MLLYTIAAIDVILWIIGMATHHRLAGYLHLLLVLAALGVATEFALRLRQARAVQSEIDDPGHHPTHRAA